VSNTTRHLALALAAYNSAGRNSGMDPIILVACENERKYNRRNLTPVTVSDKENISANIFRMF
jgi:glycosylphosphatidylinositol transamidase (GPIT) subunit GPI8